ncbi:auxin-responsive protein IAA11-like isoform X2 [Juglans microcarpa x Juglans regia]|uniref:auxin-responsive protein IAA11-like isoform X2 n=1 Tax=Juglans microcarpa x Juglans regia TaxID=2249226 RepID=UPI001B7F5EC4|nr:auxin-responsive protein IAA11-like isoform X2 [Juglans microcarpa x Juglans regia]
MQGVGGVVSGGGGGGSITSGVSMSTVSKDDNLVLSSEDSSSCLEESELELGLGLSLGGGSCKAQQGPRGGQYARFLTAKDFPYVGSSSSASSASSSSSSSSLSRANVSSGTKRSADSVAAANGARYQVVGWPPVRAYRMNSMVSQTKLPVTEVFNSLIGKSRNSNTTDGKETNNGCDKSNVNAKVKGHSRSSLFVKVNMDGTPIGRKVDLSAHSCYATLTQKLEDMFQTSSTMMNSIRSSGEEHDMMVEATRRSRLLDGSSEFVLTYEDREGDWMLVGDVPWGMFISSVRRLRIMRTSEANGLAQRSEETNGRQRTKPI